MACTQSSAVAECCAAIYSIGAVDALTIASAVAIACLPFLIDEAFLHPTLLLLLGIVGICLRVRPERWQLRAAQFGAVLTTSSVLLRHTFWVPRLPLFVLTFFSALISFVLSLMAPHVAFVKPDGPYSVGRRTVELVDTSRRAWIAAETNGPRRIPVDIYYPCATVSARRPTFVAAELLRAVCVEFSLPTWAFAHVAAATLPAQEGAPPLPPPADAAGDAGWPLVLFSHSLTGIRMQNTNLMLHLASHGFVCATVDHPYEAILTLFEDGTTAAFLFESALPRPITPTDTLRFRQRCVQYRADDLSFVRACLTAASAGEVPRDNEHPPPRRRARSPPKPRPHATSEDEHLSFLRHLLRSGDRRTLVIGHSCGGGGALLFAQQHPESCAGCVSLDGYFWWLGREQVLAGISVPLLAVHAPQFINDADECLCSNVQLTHQLALSSDASAAVHVVEVGVGHFDFTDITAIGVSPLLLRMAGIQKVGFTWR